MSGVVGVVTMLFSTAGVLIEGLTCEVDSKDI